MANKILVLSGAAPALVESVYGGEQRPDVILDAVARGGRAGGCLCDAVRPVMVSKSKEREVYISPSRILLDALLGTSKPKTTATTRHFATNSRPDTSTYTNTSLTTTTTFYHNNDMGLFSKEKEAYPSPRNSYNGPPPPTYDQPPTYAPSSSSGTGQMIKFPQRMVFNTSWVSSKSTLGPSKEEPMFHVQTPSRMYCFGNKDMILKDGLDKLAAPLATAGREKGNGWRKQHSLIRVSPLPGSGAPELAIRMEDDHHNTHPFTMLIDGQETRFEWRNTSGGAEVKALSGGYNWGWKLVRLDGPYSLPGGQSQMPEGFTSDGKEIVAVAAHPKLFRKSPEFMYLGSGARGEMGRDFEIVAIMGFLRLYELYMQQQMANSASASSASASVAAATS